MALDLARIADNGSAFAIRINGRWGEGVLESHDWLDAELVIESGFVSGSLTTILLPVDVDDWERAVDRLTEGEPAEWLTESGRTPEVRLQPDGRTVTVEIDDPAQTAVTVRVVVFVEDGWLEGLRAGLAAVRGAYPEETTKTPGGAYIWRRDAR
jgi:hypothetical protein